MSDQSMEQLRGAIEHALYKSDFDATSLAREVKRGKDYIRDFIDGRKKTLPLQVIIQIEKILDLPSGFLTSYVRYVEFDGQSLVRSESDAGNEIGFLKVVKIPVWRWRDALDGTMTDVNKKYQEVITPYFLADADSPYGFVIESDAMEPAYEAGDTVFLDGSKSIRKNADVIIYKNPVEVARPYSGSYFETRCVVRRVIGFDAQNWNVRQFNPPLEESLARDEWPVAVRIVGRAHRT